MCQHPRCDKQCTAALPFGKAMLSELTTASAQKIQRICGNGRLDCFDYVAPAGYRKYADTMHHHCRLACSQIKLAGSALQL